MARFNVFLLALIGVIGLVTCQLSREDRERELLERERERERTSFRRIAEGCANKRMDIFFVLDSSSSIYINDYLTQHRIIRDIVNQFDVSLDATRVGMLTFSDDYGRSVIGLTQNSNKQDLLASITTQNLPYMTGVTNTHIPIRYVRELTDFREDITKVMVVLTDGGSRSQGSTSREAELARNSGFYMFVVGMGQYTDEREWMSIASDPDESFIYNVTGPRALDEVQFSLPARACALPPIILGGWPRSRWSGFYMLVVVMGQYPDEREWKSIASDPDDSFIYNITGPRALDEVQFSLPPRACVLPHIILGGSCEISRVSEVYFVAGRSGQEAAQNFLESFGRRTRDQTDLLRVNFFIDGCAAIQDMQLLNEEPFICERYDRQGNAINPRGASTMFNDAVRAINDDRGANTNHVIVLFADEETMRSDRFELAGSSREAQNSATVVVAGLGIRTYRDFAQRIATDRDNFISVIGGRGQAQLLDAICQASNEINFRFRPN